MNPGQSQQIQTVSSTDHGWKNHLWHRYTTLLPSVLPAQAGKDSERGQETSHALTNSTLQAHFLFEEKRGGKRGKVQLKLSCPIKHFTTTNRLTSDSAMEPEQCKRLQNACGDAKYRSHKEPLPRWEGTPYSPPAQPQGASTLMLSTHAEKAQERCFVSK